jgi:hypothetical protein
MADAIDAGGWSWDFSALTELTAALRTLSRWRNTPIWAKEIHPSLRDKASYCHAVAVVTYQEGIQDLDVSIRLRAAGERPQPDLYVTQADGSELRFEVKAPERIRYPKGLLSSEDADGVVEKAFRSARLQLTREHAGVLVLFGFALSEAQLDLLQSSGQRFFERRGASKPHLAALHVMSCGTLIVNPIMLANGVGLGPSSHVEATEEYRLARNPYFDDRIILRLRSHPRGVEGLELLGSVRLAPALTVARLARQISPPPGT